LQLGIHGSSPDTTLVDARNWQILRLHLRLADLLLWPVAPQANAVGSTQLLAASKSSRRWPSRVDATKPCVCSPLDEQKLESRRESVQAADPNSVPFHATEEKPQANGRMLRPAGRNIRPLA